MQDKAVGIDSISLGANMGLCEKINWKSKWIIEKYDKNMKLYDKEEIDGNLLLNEGITEMLNLLVEEPAASFSNASAYIGVGNGTTAANPTQTGLLGTNKTYMPMDDTYPKVSGQTVTFRSTFGPNDGNHDWREFTVANGNSDSAKNLNRKVESSLRTKTSPDTWVIQLQITIS